MLKKKLPLSLIDDDLLAWLLLLVLLFDVGEDTQRREDTTSAVRYGYSSTRTRTKNAAR
jgi:hypothetical protein